MNALVPHLVADEIAAACMLTDFSVPGRAQELRPPPTQTNIIRCSLGISNNVLLRFLD